VVASRCVQGGGGGGGGGMGGGGGVGVVSRGLGCGWLRASTGLWTLSVVRL